MTDAPAYLLLALGLLASLTAFWVVLAGLFPRRIAAIADAVQHRPGRMLLIGLVNLLFWGALALALSSMGNAPGLGALLYLAILILAALGAGTGAGMAAVARLVGSRAQPTDSPFAHMVRGGLLLGLACLLPILGWFILLPYTALLGLGAAAYSLVARRAAALSPGESLSDPGIRQE